MSLNPVPLIICKSVSAVLVPFDFIHAVHNERERERERETERQRDRP